MIINSEKASVHYRFFNTNGYNVLDLGCGRYGFDLPFEEYSPIYFGRNGANKVVAVDYRPEEIDFYIQNESDSKYIFLTNLINSPDVIRGYINDYQITAIKCDIEGDERYFSDISKDDMSNIVEMAIEYHSFEMKDMVVDKLNEWGFYIKNDLNFENTPISMGVIFASK